MLGRQQPLIVRSAYLLCCITATAYVTFGLSSETLAPSCLRLTYQSPCSELTTCYDDLRTSTARNQSEIVRMLWQPTIDTCSYNNFQDCDVQAYSTTNHLIGQLTTAERFKSDQYQPERIKAWLEVIYDVYSRDGGLIGQPLLHGVVAYVIAIYDMSYEDIFSHICFSHKVSVDDYGTIDNFGECLHGVGYGYLLNAYRSTMEYTACDTLRVDSVEVDTYLPKAIDACENIGPLSMSTHCFFGLYHKWFHFFAYEVNGYAPAWPCDGGQVPQLAICYFSHFLMIPTLNPTFMSGNPWLSCLAKPTEDIVLACIAGMATIHNFPPYSFRTASKGLLIEVPLRSWDVCTPANLMPDFLDAAVFDIRLRACYKGALSSYGFVEQIKRMSVHSPSAALDHINRTCTIPKMEYTSMDLSQLCIKSVSNLVNGGSAYRLAFGVLS